MFVLLIDAGMNITFISENYVLLIYIMMHFMSSFPVLMS